MITICQSYKLNGFLFEVASRRHTCIFLLYTGEMPVDRMSYDQYRTHRQDLVPRTFVLPLQPYSSKTKLGQLQPTRSTRTTVGESSNVKSPRVYTGSRSHVTPWEPTARGSTVQRTHYELECDGFDRPIGFVDQNCSLTTTSKIVSRS